MPTQKFLWRLRDHALVESVSDSGESGPLRRGERPSHALCFHPGGLRLRLPFLRQRTGRLEAQPGVEEIVEQVLAVERAARRLTSFASRRPQGRKVRSSRRTPTHSATWSSWAWANRSPTTSTCSRRCGFSTRRGAGGIGARKITVSTSGLAPQIRRFAEEPVQFRLAISLHGATDPVRNQIMPVNRKYPLRELIPACEAYRQAKGRRLTFEYILIAGVNDRAQDAERLGVVARKLDAMVNLIPYNEVQGLAWKRPGEAAQESFLRIVERARVSVTLRREKGHDIDAACGQLRLQTERGA